MDDGRRAMGDGRWAMGGRRWTWDDGRRAMGGRRWPTDDGHGGLTPRRKGAPWLLDWAWGCGKAPVGRPPDNGPRLTRAHREHSAQQRQLCPLCVLCGSEVPPPQAVRSFLLRPAGRGVGCGLVLAAAGACGTMKERNQVSERNLVSGVPRKRASRTELGFWVHHGRQISRGCDEGGAGSVL